MPYSLHHTKVPLAIACCIHIIRLPRRRVNGDENDQHRSRLSTPPTPLKNFTTNELKQ